MVITGFKTVQDIKDTLDAMDRKWWIWCTGRKPQEETWILQWKTQQTYIHYCDKFSWWDSRREVDKFSNNDEIINFKDAIKEMLNWKKQKEIKLVLTYETIIRRSDWVEFKKDTIDWKTIEEVKKLIWEHRAIANKLQGLLKFHSNHF